MDIAKLATLLDENTHHDQLKIISHLKKIVDDLYVSLNFSLPPEKVIHHIGSDHKTANISQSRWGNNAALYIGKMHTSGQGIYTKELIVGMLYYAMKNNTYLEKIHLQVCQDIYLSLLSETEYQKHDIIKPKEQFLLLQNAITELFGSKASYTDYIVMEQLAAKHQNLFGYLQDEGVEGLLTWKGIHYKKSAAEVDSLDLAAFFYQLMKKYPVLQQQLFSLVPEELGLTLASDSDLWYYSLLEVACRIDDLKRGITQQGGIVRQKAYDKQIDFLLDPVSQKNIPELERIHSLGISCTDLPLSRWYFKNTTYAKSMKQLEKKAESAAVVDAIMKTG